jgi:hypothetical protein
LTGYCDYILSRSKKQSHQCPVISCGGQNENIKGGLGQCIAEMIATQIFNEREGTTIETIYGVVTTGRFGSFSNS